MSETMCYVGKTECGCMVAVATDKPEWRRETAREVARWMRDGLTIERMTVSEVHRTELGCNHEERKKVRRKAVAKQPRLI